MRGSTVSGIVRLVDQEIVPGTYTGIEKGDEWPQILATLFACEIMIFASSIGCCNHPSLIQRVIG